MSPIEIILIDDGSTDTTWDVIQQIHSSLSGIKALHFRRNYGKSAALAAGIAAAKGDILVTIDADLQDEPAEIPHLIAKLNEGFDLVSGWKKDRQDPWHKKAFSKVFNRIVSRVSHIELHDFNCGLKAYRREVFDHVHLYGEMHRFIPVLAANHGFRIAELPVTHHARQFGQSKYGYERVMRAALDFITVGFFTRYMQRPSHFFGPIGLVSILLGCFLGLGGILSFLWGITKVGGITLALGFMIGLLGVHSLFFGLVAEILTFMHRKDEPFYFVNEKLD